MFSVLAWYKFFSFPDYKDFQQPLTDFCRKHQIMGSWLLAPEGMNGTVAGSHASILEMLDFLHADPRKHGAEYKFSTSDHCPFLRMRVRLKKEIVSLGQPQAKPAVQTGTYVSPHEWNDLIQNHDVMVIDTRNDYEVRIGAFKGAINPNTQSFREFPDFVQSQLLPHRDKKVAMYCTGGIRCEKASSYLKAIGFEHVYQLRGGILKYLETVPQDQGLWDGECFVFDYRVGVGYGLEQGNHKICFACRQPVSPQEQHDPRYQAGISCPYCFETLTADRQKSLLERHRQMQLAEKRKTHHLGSVVMDQSQRRG